MKTEVINVTKSFLPPLNEYIAYLKHIWDSGQLTNNGPLLKKLESELKAFLDVKHLFFVANGTIALQIAINAIGAKGEIITTPFSYVATTSTIVWEGCYPVFVDIDPKTLCIDPGKIEEAITPNTVAILPTHVYGIPCDVDSIEKLASKYHLRVIYDAAHTFGVDHQNKSLSSYGNISILSFHATKIFHTVEGGAIITDNDDLAHQIAYMRNFGHKGQEDFWGLGINGKNSEFHAAMGLCVLPYVNQIISARKQISSRYDELLEAIDLTRPQCPANTVYNYAYYPVIFKNEEILLRVQKALNNKSIYPRRYFYPSLSQLPYVNTQKNMISDAISKRVLCLPLYEDLSLDTVAEIADIIIRNVNI
jgi:dTDP-4-amino-4,6-dideoxygalactose transaminase